MPTFPDPVDTVERFAEISATLEDPFAEEDEVLRAAGLDGEAWEQIEKRWFATLQQGDADQAVDLAVRFAQVYKATRERLSSHNKEAADIPDTEPDGQGAVSWEKHAWRTEAARVGRDLLDTPPPLLAPPASPSVQARSVAETLESPSMLPIPALPFQTPEPPRDASPDATLALGACLPLPVMPFKPRSHQ